MERTYRIGARKSPLSLKQVEEIIQKLKLFYPHFSYEIVGIDTTGDKDKITPISEIEGSDFFTKEIEEALLKGEIDPSTSFRINGEGPSTSLGTNPEFIEGRSRTIDFAVHSAKDLPDIIPEGLMIAAITKSIDPYDALVSKGNLRIDQLPKGAKIGASSMRRKIQLKKYREDFQIIDIRGNIQERLEKLDKDGLDAIVVAACALVRLGLEDKITQRIPFEILTPHPLQGCLAIEIREDDYKLRNLFKPLNYL